MRISGGVAKGRPIHFPKGCHIRPTADRVKESLFAILDPLEGSSFLDVFAGSGNVGLEALSRGAGSAVFLEKDHRLAGAIRQSLQVMGFQGRGEVLALEAGTGLRRLAARGDRFDILFADPPYEEGYLAELRSWWTGAEFLTEKGLCILQHSVREPLSELPPAAVLQLTDQRRYGDTLLTFLTKRSEN